MNQHLFQLLEHNASSQVEGISGNDSGYFWPRCTVGQQHLVPKLLEMIFCIPDPTQPPKRQFYMRSRKFLRKLLSEGLIISTSLHPGMLMVSLLTPWRKFKPVTSVENFTAGQSNGPLASSPIGRNPSGFVHF